MSARTITVTLTDRQFSALASAKLAYDGNVEGDELADLVEAATLDRAWSKISSAWHARARVER